MLLDLVFLAIPVLSWIPAETPLISLQLSHKNRVLTYLEIYFVLAKRPVHLMTISSYTLVEITLKPALTTLTTLHPYDHSTRFSPTPTSTGSASIYLVKTRLSSLTVWAIPTGQLASLTPILPILPTTLSHPQPSSTFIV